MRPEARPPSHALRLRASHLALLSALAIGCADESDPNAPDGGSGGSGDGAGGVDPGTPFPVSAKAAVRMKTATRLLRDIGAALSLDPGSFCNELGAFACADLHAISLMEMDAYDGGFYEPLAETVVTSTAAVDRIALIGCAQRVGEDFAGNDPVIFAELPMEGGALADADHPAVTEAVTRLHQQTLLRNPTSHELDLYRELYRDIAASGVENPASEWAKASCFVTLTTLEFVFY